MILYFFSMDKAKLLATEIVDKRWNKDLRRISNEDIL